MIIRAKHNFFIYNFFRYYTLLKIRLNFHQVTIKADVIDRKLPLLVISNHISWWDGFWVMYLNMKKFKRKFHFMMLEEQLNTYSFFRKTGGFSVKKGSRTIIETIEHARELLRNSNNMVLIFPQGEIQSLHNKSFVFQKGIERILKENQGKIQIIFNANLPDYLSEKKPWLSMFAREYVSADLSAAVMQDAYNSFYSECLREVITNAAG